jgi:hypothetical protein
MVCGNRRLFARTFNTEKGSGFTNRVSHLTQTFPFSMFGAMNVTPSC